MASVMQARLSQLKWVGVIHEGVPCKRKDLAACIKFYQEVLGLKLLPRPARLDEIMGYSPSGAWPTGRHTAWMVQSLDALPRAPARARRAAPPARRRGGERPGFRQGPRRLYLVFQEACEENG